MSFLFKDTIFHCVGILLCSPVHLWWTLESLPHLAPVNNAAMNISVHMSVWDSVCNYFGHTPTSRTAGYILLSFWIIAIIWTNGYRLNSQGIWKAMHFRGKWKQEFSVLISYTFASIRRVGHFIRTLRNWRNCVSPQSTCWSQVGNQQRFSVSVTDKQGRQSPQRKRVSPLCLRAAELATLPTGSSSAKDDPETTESVQTPLFGPHHSLDRYHGAKFCLMCPKPSAQPNRHPLQQLPQACSC